MLPLKPIKIADLTKVDQRGKVDIAASGPAIEIVRKTVERNLTVIATARETVDRKKWRQHKQILERARSIFIASFSLPRMLHKHKQ